jgi:hypothetical protein
MSKEPERPWEDRVKQAGERAQEELRRVLHFIDDEVVPEVRRNGSSALRVAADQLQKLADHLDTARQAEHGSGPDDKPGA